MAATIQLDLDFLRCVSARFIASGVLALAAGCAAPPPAPVIPVAAPPSAPDVPDRALFFADSGIRNAHLSPDGRFLAFEFPHQGRMALWVRALREPWEDARRVTDPAQTVDSWRWSLDSRALLALGDEAGNEQFALRAIDVHEAPGPDGLPPARLLAGGKGMRTAIAHLPRSSPRGVYVTTNERDPKWFDLYLVDIATGVRTEVFRNTARIARYAFDTEDRLRAGVQRRDDGGADIVRIDAAGVHPIHACEPLAHCELLRRFHPDNRRAWLLTNQGSDLTRLTLLDVESGRLETVDADPEGRVDVDAVGLSNRDDRLLWTAYADDGPRRYFHDATLAADWRWLREGLPGLVPQPISTNAAETLWLIRAWSDTEPGQVWLFDRSRRTLDLQYRERPTLPRETLVAMHPIRYASSDGLMIPAFLTLPAGVPPRNLPLVVRPHGGPWARDDWGFDPMTQFLASRGYAVLQPNFRGSLGFGKRFLDAGRRQWGHRMQDDLTWGVRHLVSQGIVDAQRVAIWGHSYGGYATLAGAAFTPELYAAAIAEAAPADLVNLIRSVPPWWEFFRRELHLRAGDPETEEGRAQLARQSPLHQVGRIRAPLLLVHGANDPRAPRTDADAIVRGLHARGGVVDYLLAPDEGHVFEHPLNRMAVTAAAEAFLARHLGGRAQSAMPADVAARLGVLRQDPAMIAPPAPAPAPAPATPPAPAASSAPAQ